MKEVTLKIAEIKEAYDLLENPKDECLSDLDKIKVWRISRKLSPFVKKYKEEQVEANKKFLPQTKEFADRLEKAIKYELAKQNKLEQNASMTEDEYSSFKEEYFKYQKLVEDALYDIKNTEETIEIEPLSDEALGGLKTANKWSFEQLDKVSFVLE